MRVWRWGAALVLALAVAHLLAPPALFYDAEAWLVWGRELANGTLDVSVGPAIKPLPILADAAAVTAFGTDIAWHVWSSFARASLVVALLLTARFVREATSDRIVTGFAVVAVLGIPTMLSGALHGASEAAVFGLLVVAAQLAGARRHAAAAAVLATAALLRPEAAVLAVVVLACALPEWPKTWRPLAAAALCLTLTPVAWLALQWLGGGSAGDGVAAATALRSGQPGLAGTPALATVREALTMMLWPVVAALVLWVVAWGRATGGPRSDDVRRPRGSLDHERALRWFGAFGALWVATVAVLAEAGFSGEPRYLAPGIASATVATVALVGIRATSPVRARPLWVGIASVAAAAAAIVAVAPAAADQRALHRSQSELDTLFRQLGPTVSARCSTLAVPRYLRPAVAWRLNRPMARVQSPDLRATGCALQRDRLPRSGSRGTRRILVADSGRWSWWVDPVDRQ